RRAREIDEAPNVVGAGRRNPGIDDRDADTAAVDAGREQAAILEPERRKQRRRRTLRVAAAGQTTLHRRIERDADDAGYAHEQLQLQRRKADGDAVDETVLRVHDAAKREHSA